MRDLAALLALYSELDRSLDNQRAVAASAGDSNAVMRIQEKQRLNDQAYFVIIWGQMEAEIDEACRTAIRVRRAKPDWADRRCWNLFNPDDKRLSGLSFEERAAIVLDKDGWTGQCVGSRPTPLFLP